MPYQKQYTLLPILGLNTGSPGEYIDDRATPNCQNIHIDRNVLSKRIGTTQIGSSMGEETMGIYELISEGGTRFVIRIGLTKIELLVEATGTWVDITGAALTGTASDVFSYATPLLAGLRVACFTNFIDYIRKYTGVGNVALFGGTPPKAKFMIEYGAYLVLAYVNDGSPNDFPMRVQWSDTGDIENWSSGNAGTIDLLEDGNNITGMALFSDYVCVHKESCIYLGYLVPTEEVFRFDRKTTGVGTICNATIQNLNTGEQIFLARDGLRLFNGVSTRLIESQIQDDLREQINPQYVHKCWSIVVPELDEYWVGVPIGSQTNPDTVYKYNYKTGQCYKDYRPNISAAGKYQKTDAKTWEDISDTWDSYAARWDDITILALHQTVLFGDTSGNTTYRDAISNDNTIAIPSFWESKDYETEEKGRIGQWLEMQVWAKGNGVKIEYSINAGLTWVEIGTYNLSSDYPSDDSPLFAYFDVTSSKIRFRFSNNELGETFYLKQFITKYRPREMRM